MTNYRRKKKPEKKISKDYTINEDITNDRVKIINEEGLVGVYSRSEALALAEEMDKDLVLINPKSDPAIAKLIEFSKFKYQMEKAESGIKSKAAEVKILMVSVRISENDLLVRSRKADAFLKDGMKVKLQVKMRGREKAFPDIAKETLNVFIKLVTEEYVFETQPTLEGDSYTVVIKHKK